jgi:hypothetical protein
MRNSLARLPHLLGFRGQVWRADADAVKRQFKFAASSFIARRRKGCFEPFGTTPRPVIALNAGLHMGAQSSAGLFRPTEGSSTNRQTPTDPEVEIGVGNGQCWPLNEDERSGHFLRSYKRFGACDCDAHAVPAQGRDDNPPRALSLADHPCSDFPLLHFAASFMRTLPRTHRLDSDN